MSYAVYWAHTDAVSKSLFAILLVMSVVSWMVMAWRYSDTWRLKKGTQQQLQAGVDALHLNALQLSTSSRQTLLEHAMQQQLGRYRLRVETSLAVLGTIASVAPFVGLFGTVWGIFHALHTIGQTGQAGLGQVAGPVGEALIMTGFGLAVAIPAVLSYNLCIRQNRRFMACLQDTAHDLVMYHLLPHEPKVATSQTSHETPANTRLC